MITAALYLCIYLYGLLRAVSGKPLWGVVVYFLCFYAHAPTQWWGQYLPDLRWSLIASLVTLVAVVIYPPRTGLKFFAFRENRWLTAFFIYLLIQLSFVNHTSLHADYVLLFLKFMAFIFIFQNSVLTVRDLRVVLITNAIGGAFLAYQGFSLHSGGRLEGIGTPGMDDANLLGQHLVVLVLLLGYAMLEPVRKMHLLLAVSLCMVLMALFLTESRGAIVSLALVFFCSIMFIPKGRKKKFAGFVVLGLVACSLLVGPQIVERFQGVEKDSAGQVIDKSARSRLVIIEAQIQMWLASPIVGHGHRGTLVLSKQFIPAEYLSNNGYRASHNLIMSMLVDHGIVGSLLYLGAFISSLSRIFWVNRKLAGKDNSRHHPDEIFLRAMIVGVSLALLSYWLGGMTSNNKKLEGDIWAFALIPVVSLLLKQHCLLSNIAITSPFQSANKLIKRQSNQQER